MGIDGIIKKRHLLTHPFYKRWQKGKVSTEVLKEYAKQYYHYEAALPSFLNSALKHLPAGSAKKAVTLVLADETSHPKPHTELWMDFAAGLGLSAKEVQESPASPRTKNLVETYTSLCARGSDEALGALYSYEAQVPEVAKTKGDGLREFYGLTDDESLKFFDLHATLDVQHAKAIRSGFEDSEFARESAHLALDAWWGMLDQFEQMADSAPGPAKSRTGTREVY